MTTNSTLTDEILREAIEQMPNPTFDSHDLIQHLMRRRTRDYVTALHMTEGQDPIQNLHATIGRRLTAFDIIEKTGNVKSMNVRGEVSDNEGWRKK